MEIPPYLPEVYAAREVLPDFQREMYGLFKNEDSGFAGLLKRFFCAVFFDDQASCDFRQGSAEIAVIGQDVPDFSEAGIDEYFSGNTDDIVFKKDVFYRNFSPHLFYLPIRQVFMGDFHGCMNDKCAEKIGKGYLIARDCMKRSV
jgi:hypothetical protein